MNTIIRKLMQLTLMMAAVALFPARAHAVVLDFEGISDLESVTNQFAGSDVTFSNATGGKAFPFGTLNEIDFPPVSGSTVITNEIDTTGDGLPDSTGKMTIDFISNAYQFVSGYFTYSDVDLMTFIATGATLDISAFSPTDPVNPVLTIHLFSNAGFPTFLQFLGYGPISSLEISGAPNTAFALDDFTFQDPFRQQPPGNAVVPEPGTFALLALGLGGFILRRKSLS